MQVTDLENFRALNAALKNADERQCSEMLEHEKNHGNRLSFLLRIYGRMNKLRATRERLELFNNARS